MSVSTIPGPAGRDEWKELLSSPCGVVGLLVLVHAALSIAVSTISLINDDGILVNPQGRLGELDLIHLLSTDRAGILIVSDDAEGGRPAELASVLRQEWLIADAKSRRQRGCCTKQTLANGNTS